MVKFTSVLVTLVTAVAFAYADDGNVYWYNCGNCKCNASGARTGFTGTTGCVQITSDVRSLGLTRSGSLETTCDIFTDTDCVNLAQHVGVYSGQTWGCTALNQFSGSMKCYYNV